MSSSDKHWVEDLFPPVYTLTIDDVLEKDEEKPSNVYELAAKRVSQYDPETIKNIFERVWLFLTVQEQQKQTLTKDHDISSLKIQGTLTEKPDFSSTSVTGSDPATLTDLEQIILKVLRETQGKKETEKVDIADSKLWSSNEIGEIRKVYGQAKKENIKLKAALEEAESRIKKLEKKNKQQFSQFAGKEDALEEAQKANGRLEILVKKLKTNLGEVQNENASLVDEVQNLKETGIELLNEISELRKDCDSERIKRKNAEIDMEEVRKIAQRDLELSLERAELRYEKQIVKLESEIEKLKSELEKEKQDHRRTRKGLEHLQTHFSSLPYRESEARKNMVTQNQLKTWTS